MKTLGTTHGLWISPKRKTSARKTFSRTMDHGLRIQGYPKSRYNQVTRVLNSFNSRFPKPFVMIPCLTTPPPPWSTCRSYLYAFTIVTGHCRGLNPDRYVDFALYCYLSPEDWMYLGVIDGSVQWELIRESKLSEGTASPSGPIMQVRRISSPATSIESYNIETLEE